MGTELRRVGVQDIFMASGGAGVDETATSAQGVVVTKLDAKQITMQGVGTNIEDYLTALYGGGITGSMLGAGILGTQHFGTFSVPTHAIASGAVGTAQMVSTLKPVVIVSSLPDAASYSDGDVLVLTTDSQLYRNVDGTGWTAAVPATGITGSITQTQISDGAIVTGKIAANAIYGSQIVASEIAGSHVVANAITTAKIAAGAVTTDELGARAIFAQNVVVANWENVIPNPNSLLGATAANYLPEGTGYYAGTHAYSGTYCRKFVASAGDYFFVTPSGTLFGTQWAGDYIPAQEGDVWYMSAQIKEEAGGGEVCGAYLRFYNGSESAVGDGTHALVTSNSFAQTFLTATAPANTEFMVGGFYAAHAGTYYIDNMVLRKSVDSNLIVDGAISADKISGNVIQGSHIQSGQIDADHITGGVIVGTHISGGVIVGTHIAGSTITAGLLAADSVVAANVNVSYIDEFGTNMGTITAGVVKSGNYAAPTGAVPGTGCQLDLTSGELTAYGADNAFGGPLVMNNGTNLVAIGKSLTATGLTFRYPTDGTANWLVDGRMALYEWSTGSSKWLITAQMCTTSYGISVGAYNHFAYGGNFYGTTAPIRLQPASGTAAPTHTAGLGSLYVTQAGVLYINTSGGTTWAKVGAQ